MEKSSPYIQRVRDLYQVAFNTLRRRQKYRRFYDKTWSVYIGKSQVMIIPMLHSNKYVKKEIVEFGN